MMPLGSESSTVERVDLLLDGQGAVGPLLADRARGDDRLLRLGLDRLAHEGQHLGGLGRRLVGQLLSFGVLVLELHLGPRDWHEEHDRGQAAPPTDLALCEILTAKFHLVVRKNMEIPRTQPRQRHMPSAVLDGSTHCATSTRMLLRGYSREARLTVRDQPSRDFLLTHAVTYYDSDVSQLKRRSRPGLPAAASHGSNGPSIRRRSAPGFG